MPHIEHQGKGWSPSPALIGMSLQQDNPGGLLSSRARFRFSCQTHSATEGRGWIAFSTQWKTVPLARVSKVDTVQSSHATIFVIGDTHSPTLC